MENKSFKQQLTSFYSSDIIFAQHGGGLTNLIFSTPHTVVVECNPPYFYGIWYVNTASLSRVYYIGISTFYPNNQKNQMWKKAEKAYYDGDFERIHRQYADFNVNPPKQSVLIAIEKGIAYSMRWRFVYETTNKWSPLFYSCVYCEMSFIPSRSYR